MHKIADWDPWFVGPMRDTHMRWSKGWWKVNSKEEMDNVSKDKYREHYALVRKVTPKERLLEYKLGDGWKPLCKFLGTEVPDCPFPKVNDNDVVWEQMAIIARRGMRNAAWRVLQLGAVGLVVTGAIWWGWQYRS